MNDSAVWKSLDRAHDKIRDTEDKISNVNYALRDLKGRVRRMRERLDAYEHRMDKVTEIMNAFGETEVAADLGLRLQGGDNDDE